MSDVAANVVIWQRLAVNFAERVDFAVKRSGKTQMQIEEEALSKGALSRVIDGKRGLSRASIEKLAKALGVSVGWLASGEGLMTSEVSVVLEPHNASTLDELIEKYDWPGELAPDLARSVVKQLREEHFKMAGDLPMTYFSNRLRRLVDEALGRAKSVPSREPAEVVDLTQESPEIRAARKRPKRL